MYDFGYLKPISKIIDMIGRLVISLSILGAIYFFSMGNDSILIGIAVLIIGCVLGLLLMFISNLANLFLQIEENTRKKLS